MGCDGGTIPKRKEIVKNKDGKPRKERANGADEAERWKNCVICDFNLKKPIVAGQWGHIFDKECVLEYLIETRRQCAGALELMTEKSPALDSMRRMKDFKELKLKDNHNRNGSQASDSKQEDIRADFVCPVTDLETNGKYKFVFSWNCGCVVSERAHNTVKDDKCLVCQTPYKPFDIVILNPNEKDLERNQSAHLVREMAKIDKPPEQEAKLIGPNPMRTPRIPKVSCSEIRAERKFREAKLRGKSVDQCGSSENPQPSTSKDIRPQSITAEEGATCTTNKNSFDHSDSYQSRKKQKT